MLALKFTMCFFFLSLLPLQIAGLAPPASASQVLGSQVRASTPAVVAFREFPEGSVRAVGVVFPKLSRVTA